MNVKALMKIAQLPEMEDLFVCPSPNDESLAIGAAYVLEHEAALAQSHDPDKAIPPLPDAYLGPDLDPR